ncbi:MAG TPA: DUF255 domain-containing protein [Polyangiaceae bacterium]
MRRPLPLLISTVLAALGGQVTLSCAPAAHAPPATAAGGSGAPAPSAEAEEGPSAAPKEALAWATLDAAMFAKAKAEHRFVVIDGSAEWCHWCHVMEATTYHDPEVRKLLDARFIAVKVDVDSRPDFEERYVDWGWPATVLMTADGAEIGKYKGYLPPEKFLEILQGVVDGEAAKSATGVDAAKDAGPALPLTPGQRADAAARVQKQLDEYWDAPQGGWGIKQKAPVAWDNAWALVHQRDRALFTLAQQRGIIDPVWSGVCQYSTDGDWQHPHYEKLMTVQAGAIANYAQAYALTHDSRWLSTALMVRNFVDGFMTSPEGGFETTMDADLNAHDPSKPFMAGGAYYAKSDAERRALGIPRVDTHEYGRENGLAIAAYVTLYEASGDATVLASPKRAVARILATHASDALPGGITHGTKPEDEGKVLYLADNAAFGWGLLRLYQATHDAPTLEAAKGIAAFMMRALYDAQAGGFYASTPDPNAVGAFAVRRKPFEDDVMAVRFLALLDRLASTREHADAIGSTLAIVTRPDAVDARGRMVGDLLLALDDVQ